MDKNKVLRIAGIVAAALIAIYAFGVLTDSDRGFDKVDTSIAIKELDAKNVKEAEIKDREQTVQLKLKKPIEVEGKEGIEQITSQYPARASQQIFDAVKGSEAEKFDTHVSQDSFLGSMLMMLLPMLLIFGLLFFMLTRMQSGGGMGPFGFGKSRAKDLQKDNPDTRFDDVAGADEAVEEAEEIRDFLSDPGKYEKPGAKIPRGVLLYGPAGTGTTLLARA